MNKELKNKIYNEYLKCWNERMAKYCTGEIADAIETPIGIVKIVKRRIQNSFWFGYSDCGQGLSYEANEERMENIENRKYKYFKRKNLEDLIETIENLKTSNFVYVYPVCYGDTPINLYKIEIGKYDKIAEGEKPYRNLDCAYIPLTGETKDAVIKMYEKFLIHETKRVENYVKRFGKNITIRSYWIDR